MRSPRHIFYGWYIVGAGLVITTIQGGLYVYGFGAYFSHFQSTFGASKSQIAGVLSLTRLEGGIMAPFAGYLIDRYGPRRLMAIGLSLMGFGFIILSRITTLWMLYAAFVVMGTGSSFGSSRPVQVSLANWFVRRRGRVMGFLMTGFGIGGTFVFAVVWLIDTYGWRTTALMSGLIMWGVSLPMSLVVRHKPEDMGLLPDGDQPVEVQKATSVEGGSAPSDAAATASVRVTSAETEVDFTPKQALKTRSFWMLVIVYGTWAILPPTMSALQIDYLQSEVGVSFTQAGVAVSAFSAISLFGRVPVGWLGDYINPRYLLAGLFVAMGIGLLVMSMIQTAAQIPFYIVILAPAYGGSIPLRPTIQGYFFGRKSFGTIGGLLQFFDLPVTVAAPVLVAYIADVYSYRVGFQLIAVLVALGAVVVLLARRPELAEEPEAELSPAVEGGGSTAN